MTIEEIIEKYKQRIFNILNGIRENINDNKGLGLSCTEPFEMDTGQFSMLVQTEDERQDEYETRGIDVSFSVLDSEEHDDEENGVNFGIDIVACGGEIIGGLCPYNYQEECWVDRNDEAAVEERFKLMEQADSSEATYLIEEYYKKSS